MALPRLWAATVPVVREAQTRPQCVTLGHNTGAPRPPLPLPPSKASWHWAPPLRTSLCHFPSAGLRPPGAQGPLTSHPCGPGFLNPGPGILGLTGEGAWTSLKARVVSRVNKNKVLNNEGKKCSVLELSSSEVNGVLKGRQRWLAVFRGCLPEAECGAGETRP